MAEQKDGKKYDEKDMEIARLKALLGTNGDVDPADAARGPAPLDPKFEGLKSYQLTEKHYRDGVTYEPGQRVTVLNEKPGKSWTPIAFDPGIECITKAPVADKSTAPAGGPLTVLPQTGLNAPVTRASDRSI